MCVTAPQKTTTLVNNKDSCPQMTLNMCDSACVHWINTNTQYNHPETRACVVQVLPGPSGLFYLHHWLLWWDEAPSEGLGWAAFPRLHLAVNLRQAIILLLTATCQSISTSETHTHTHSVSVAGLRVLPQWPGTDVRVAVCLFFSTRRCTTDSNITQTYTHHKHTHSLHLCDSYSHRQT